MDLLEKIRLGALAQAHNLADKVIDLDSIGAVEQQIRDLQNNFRGLKNDQAEAEGHVRLVVQDRDELLGEAAGLQRAVDTLLTDDDDANDANAVVLQARLNAVNDEIAALNEEITSGTKVASELREAVGIIDAQLARLKSQLSRLRSLDRTAKSKSRSVKAIEKANDILGDGVDVDIDSVARKIREKAAISDVKFEQALEGVKSTVSQDVAISQASADIARRKKELAAKTLEQATPAPAAVS